MQIWKYIFREEAKKFSIDSGWPEGDNGWEKDSQKIACGAGDVKAEKVEEERKVEAESEHGAWEVRCDEVSLEVDSEDGILWIKNK